MRRLLIACALLLWWGMAQAQDFIRYIPPSGLATMTGTATATTSTVPFLLPNGTTGAPALAFSSDTGSGIYRNTTSGYIRFSVSGVDTRIGFKGSTGINIGSSAGINWTDSASPDTTIDTILGRDAANTLALRNGGASGATVPQTFNIYNFCDGAACVTGYERGYLGFVSNEFRIGTAAAGTGAARQIALMAQYVTLRGSLGLVVENSDQTNFGEALRQPKTLYLSRSIEGSKSKALTDNTATAFATMAMPQTAGSNYGGGQMIYTIFCKDAANQAQQSGTVKFACMNLAGTESCGFGTPDGVTLGDGTAGLGTPTFTAAAGADLVTISVQSDCTGIAPTTHTIQVRFDLQQPNTLAFP